MSGRHGQALLRGAACLLAFLVFFVPGIALAYEPPALRGPVTDPAGTLSAAETSRLEVELRAYRARTGHEVAVFVAPSLEGNTIEDVAYGAFNTWGIGRKGDDDGVLLVIAPVERRMRIETGKGVGDRLTDLESSQILEQQVGPALRDGHLYRAIFAGTTAIERALDRGGAAPATARAAKGSGAGVVGLGIMFFLIPIVLIALLVVIIVGASRRGRRRGGYDAGSSGVGNDVGVGGSYTGSVGGDFGGGGGGFSGGGGGDFGGGGSSGGGGASGSF